MPQKCYEMNKTLMTIVEKALIKQLPVSFNYLHLAFSVVWHQENKQSLYIALLVTKRETNNLNIRRDETPTDSKT